jgi:para-aminobenzoate synthetase component 1
MQRAPRLLNHLSADSREFAAGSRSGRLPLVEELSPCPDVFDAVKSFAAWPGLVVLESALQREHVGRFSYLTADPIAQFVVRHAALGSDPFAGVRRQLLDFRTSRVAGLPPFQGGAVGLLSYELGRCWERLPQTACDEFQLPAAAIGLYDWVLAWDHATGRAWVISHGFPETNLERRVDCAARRLASVLSALRGSAATGPYRNSELGARSGGTLSSSELVRQWQAPGPRGLTSSFSRNGYLAAVERVIEYIHAGDIFQANLSQRLLFPATRDPLDLYARLRQRNPAPFAGLFLWDDWAVVSASPERFVCVRDNEVETRPIKGTRKRREPPEADLFTRDELRQSQKDQSENVMIVDLLRNDLSRVCEPGSIRVPQFCRVETYETVQHLVSEIRGTLAVRSGGAANDVWDLLRAVFPGGSITGAPKVRAMEIIAELEPTARGPYCGSLFYVGFDGTMDSSILIRTFTCRRGWIQCPVGGGIVAQSDPAAEYEETLHKAEGMLRALE